MSQLLADVLSRGAAGLFGVFLLFATTVSLMRTVVIPRSLRSVISDTVAKVVVGTAVGLARLARTYARRDAILAWAGPLIILLQLLTWLVLYLIAYGLIIYGVSGQGLGEALRQAGSSLFTLGFAAVDTESQTIVDFMAAATGPVVVALMIGFLPTIYSAYLDREEDVTELSAAAGEPPWGPELLARASLGENLDGLPGLFIEWAHWATRLRMTHVTYPVLVWVRSARTNRHFIVSLLAIMDAASLMLALNSRMPRREAFVLLLQGGQAMEVLYVALFERRSFTRRLGFTGKFEGSAATSDRRFRLPARSRHMLAIQAASDMDAVKNMGQDAVLALAAGEQHTPALTRADFDQAVDLLQRAGFPIDRDLDEAWKEFRIARSRYEFPAYQICRRLDAVPAPWAGPRRVPTETLWPTLVVDVVTTIDKHIADTSDPDPSDA